MNPYIIAAAICLLLAVIWECHLRILAKLEEIKTLIINKPNCKQSAKPMTAKRKAYLKRWRKNRKNQSTKT